MATLNDFVEIINDEITKYTNEIKGEIEKKLDETADKILSYIIANAPRSGKKESIADNFIKEDQGSGVNKTVVIYAKDKGRLVHLIEFGFQHKSGKYVGPRPFLRPAFDAFTPEMLDKIRSIISGK